MDEATLRNNVAQAALSWKGTLEGSPRHAEIIAIYNSIRRPGYPPMTVDLPWCATFASVVAYQAGVESIVCISASCTDMINWFNARGQFYYGKTHFPSVGDFVFYDWQQDQKCDHVGIVTKIVGGTIYVCEGNRDGHGNPDYVGVRDVTLDYAYLYGIGTPDYRSITESGVQLATTPVKYTPPSARAWEDWMEEGQRNWLRGYRLEAGLEDEKGGFTLGAFDGPNKPPLRIAFNVEKGDYETQNNSTVRIWNLGKKHRDILSTPSCYVKLRAGYGAHLPEITEGAVTRAIDSYEGGNLVTEIELVDIRRAIRDTYVAVAFKEAISGDEVIRRLVERMGLIPSEAIRFEEGLVWIQYERGFVFAGAALKGIEKVCIAHGYLCTILNGNIDIHRKGAILQERAIVISAETGLIGNPKKLIETVDSVYYLRGWQIDFMLNGAVDLGTLVRLESPFLTGGYGYYDIVELQISGDSMGDSWTCSAKLQDPYFGDVKLFDPNVFGFGNMDGQNSSGFIGG